MFKHRRVLYLMFTGLLYFHGVVPAQQRPGAALGIFEDSTDIGATHKGSTIYDAASGNYRVTGGGADMWGAVDAFHFSWLRLSGDASLTADVHFAGGNAVALKKAVLIFRESLDPASSYADVAIHGDGHITLQYRESAGGVTMDTTSTEHDSTRLRITRKGNEFTIYAGQAGGKLTASPPKTIVLHDPVYVGIGVCAHNADGIETVTFSNVTVERTGQSAPGKK